MVPMTDRFDLIVIGGGSGGVRAARRAAEQKAAVALFEGGRLGGTCVNAGCVPKKLLSFAAHAPEDTAIAAGHGWRAAAAGSFDWPALRAAMGAYIEQLNGIYLKNLRTAGVSVFSQQARLAGANAVEAAGRRYQAERILIATGARPALPPIPGLREFARTSDDMFSLPQLPKSAIVAGAGYIAVEFACILAGLGTDTTLVHRGPTILKNFDTCVQKRLLEHLRARGVRLHLEPACARSKKPAPALAPAWTTAPCSKPSCCSRPPAGFRTPPGSDLNKPASGSAPRGKSSLTKTSRPASIRYTPWAT